MLWCAVFCCFAGAGFPATSTAYGAVAGGLCQTVDAPEFRTIELGTLSPERVVPLLNDLFGNRDDTSILIDRRNRRLVMQAPADVQQHAANLVRAVQNSASAKNDGDGKVPAAASDVPQGRNEKNTNAIAVFRPSPIQSMLSPGPANSDAPSPASAAGLRSTAPPFRDGSQTENFAPAEPQARRLSVPPPYQQPLQFRLQALLGSGLSSDRQPQPRFTCRSTDQREAHFQIDAKNNALTIEGDSQLVSQLSTLVTSLIQSSPPLGRSLAFIRAEKTPTQKLQQALNAFSRDSQGTGLPTDGDTWKNSLPTSNSLTPNLPNLSNLPPDLRVGPSTPAALQPRSTNAGDQDAGARDAGARNAGARDNRSDDLRPNTSLHPASSKKASVQTISFLGPLIQQQEQEQNALENLPPATAPLSLSRPTESPSTGPLVPRQDRSETPPANSGNLPDFGGNVDVELLPDLDVIILRGRDQDLQQLADIIEQLETISQQTQPEVEVYPLQNSNSDALVEVINEVLPELIQGRQGRVTVNSLSKPNSLLLIGWGDAINAVKDLIAKLDVAVDPASQFKVYRLKNAAAEALTDALAEFLNDRPALGTRARFTLDPRTNSVIVSAGLRDFLEIDRLIEQLDSPTGMATSRVQVIQAKHLLATDLANTLRLALNAIQEGDSRSPLLELLTIDATGAQVIRSGALQDISITPQPPNNSILLSAPPQALPLLLSLIDQLDQPGSTAQMKIFKIVHSDAASIVQVMRSLLPAETTGGQPFRLPNGGDETSLVPLRFSIDTRTNSVLAIGNQADLKVVEALVLRLDEQGSLDRKTVVYHLKNAPARDISAAINQFLVNQRQLNLASPGSINPYQQLEQEVIIVPEPVGNRLILSATSRYFDEISQLIQKLDEAPPQVMIQVLIAEVTLNSADEFGVELGLQDTVLFDRSLLGDLLTTVNTTTTSTAAGVVTVTEEVVQSATNQPGFNFNSTSALGNSGSDRSLSTSRNVGGQGISNFSVGRVNSELGFGGLVLSASGRNVSALLRALQESRRLEILSRPQIRSLDNQPAYIQVGQRVPRIIGSTVNQNGQTNTVALENVGLIMGVTPRISPDGTVVMEVDAEKSQLGPELDGIPVSVSADGTIIRSPRIDTTTAQTTVSAASGETIVLGGLITKSSEQINRKVPWLGDIPILKNLFRYDSNSGRRTELIIILTPHVIRSSLDSDRIKELEIARMSWCAADVYEIHGDININREYFDMDAPTEVIYPDGPAPAIPQID